MSKTFWKITFCIFTSLILVFAVLSCKKSSTPSSLKSLNGTEWKCIYPDGSITLSFLSEREALFVEVYEQETKESRCTYTYNNPDVTLTFIETSNSVTGTVKTDGSSLEIPEWYTLGRVK